MKRFSINKMLTMVSGVTLTLVLSASSVTYAQDGNRGKQFGMERAQQTQGHSNEQGKRLGHENERNPFYGGDETGVDFDLTVHNHAIMPTVTFTKTYNSLMTIQEVITDIVGDSTGGFYFQECYEELDLMLGTISDCTDGESPTPLDSNLTLEEAGIVDDPEVHLVYMP